jgi:hypothetical protein
MTDIHLTSLRIAMFMAIGASNTLLMFSRLDDERSAVLDLFGGHTGVMDEVASHLAQLVQAYEAHDNHPGVFEYEVAEEAGSVIVDELSRHGDDLQAARAATKARLDAALAAFFNPSFDRFMPVVET